ncbi:hypothetical protein HETIRDRAFT_449934 [Heterobasidion irregulare TC 32-1]|uniref:Uncharacterized protein n=1 Tax=Heterobasidion irregulare (strain TC 32-1) TaxID=747525 RepID=W4KF56_HETIT|nr:uncharacterized protein HETIRDRAFT_449934 [Heterobasidion irregulare TC 32-1]ETW84473.1 hypothetical protein HETIRDRAFT_449934 [Heterobasidion irregulare TC 32-1]
MRALEHLARTKAPANAGLLVPTASKGLRHVEDEWGSACQRSSRSSSSSNASPSTLVTPEKYRVIAARYPRTVYTFCPCTVCKPHRISRSTPQRALFTSPAASSSMSGSNHHLHEVILRWPHSDAHQVIVTGTFDQASSPVP